MFTPIHPGPRGGCLPMTHNMPFITASMPTRSRVKNMTGIYLGLEGNIQPPHQRMVPPLARARGMSSRIRTPSEDRRYKMVELLRIKEESKGFSGQTVRKRPVTSARPDTAGRRKWGPAKRLDTSNVDDLIKTNPRKYTPIANSGVTRSENLTGWMSFYPDAHVVMREVPLGKPEPCVQDSMDHFAQDLSGLEQCYKKICTGNAETVHSLLPNRQRTTSLASQQSASKRENTAAFSTGFSVRSYRNPNQAEILADFPVHHNTGRPKTVPIHRPHFKQLYCSQFYNQTRLVAPKSCHTRKQTPVSFEEPLDVQQRSTPGPVSGGLNKGQLHNSLASSPEKQTLLSRTKTFHAVDDTQQLQISMPFATSVTLTDDDTKVSVDLMPGPDTDHSARSNITSKMATLGKSVELCCDEDFVLGSMKTSTSAADIKIGLENEDGTGDTVEIDVADEDTAVNEIPRGNVRKASIVDKLVKSKESEAKVAMVKETAEQRQKAFEKLLNEHAEIVQEISRTASSENLLEQDKRDH
ncbi:uncharacterized protein LOC121371531 [Gigantopelta aegis]|uniref:uncharacterized protein LOC121371531 n=1 Tax=Gigantopelta aegis TaxID=1735272 RepID=UPI001B88D069|nr:uncharacterized protein LOC121371531 [Gigantopelta aegis]